MVSCHSLEQIMKLTTLALMTLASSTLVLLCGCVSAQWVSRKEAAEHGVTAKSGEIRYELHQGEEAAAGMMSDYCGGLYRLTNTYAAGSDAALGEPIWINVRFTCL